MQKIPCLRDIFVIGLLGRRSAGKIFRSIRGSGRSHIPATTT
jgi:hypothetical protein